MNYILEQTLKSIVYEINEIVKRNKKNQLNAKNNTLHNFISEFYCKNIPQKSTNLKCEGFILKFNNEKSAPYQEDCTCIKIEKILKKQDIFYLINEKLEPSWPLKKGMVNSNLIAWHLCNSALETNQRAFAFMIKCLSLTYYLEKIPAQNQYYFPYLFDNEFATLFFWHKIRNYYLKNLDISLNKGKQQQFFFNEVLPKNKLIILSLEETFFRLRSGSNFELHAFEQFINDLILAKNGLVIFSKQKLIPDKSHELYRMANYSITFKKNLDEHKISLKEAMEPDYKVAKDDRFIEANKVGAFDRLIELLSIGQEQIHFIERNFSEWKKKSEN